MVAYASALVRLSRRTEYVVVFIDSQHPLQHVYVQPLAELEPHFLERPDEHEAHAQVEVQALFAPLSDTGDHRVELQSPGLFQDRLLEPPADPLAAELAFDVEA